MREGPNDVHLNQDEEVWAVAPSVRRAGGRRQESGGRRQPPPDGDSFPAPPLRAGDAAGHNV